HFSLVTSPDPESPGPDTFAVNSGSPISPDGNWVENGPNSRWIAPQADESVVTGGNTPGRYVYRISFDLGTLDPETAVITGSWAVATSLPELLLNGKVTGLQIGPFEPDRLLRPFTLAGGFISGVNTLDFGVQADGAVDIPTGVRVELQGTAGE